MFKILCGIDICIDGDEPLLFKQEKQVMDEVSFTHSPEGMEGNVSPVCQGTQDGVRFASPVAEPFLSLVAVDWKWVFDLLFHTLLGIVT